MGYGVKVAKYLQNIFANEHVEHMLKIECGYM